MSTKSPEHRVVCVIEWIESFGDTFTFAELKRGCAGRRETLYNILSRLHFLGYINRTQRAWDRRNWWATQKWQNAAPSPAERVTKIFDDYSTLMQARVAERGRK